MNRAIRLKSFCALLVTLPVLLAPVAEAVDGVVLIDQNRALAGNVTPGDLPGFPVTISRAGSYRLSGNLDVADPDGNAIEITANDVTLDLNGFRIQGPLDQCSFSLAPAWCQTVLHGFGIIANRDPSSGEVPVNVVVLNGTIRAMGSIGVLLGHYSRVEGLRVRDNRGGGLAVDSDSLVLNNIASGNALGGLFSQIMTSGLSLMVNNVCVPAGGC